MSSSGPSRPAGPNPSRLFAIVTAVAVMAVALYVVIPERPAGRPAESDPALSSVAAPVASEALVFRKRWGNVAAALDGNPRAEARQRSLAFYRRLRAFPGAPPRIPHGLTADEYRNTRCTICHERGGYAARFGAYAPMTPHPDYPECLQCHVPEAMSVGVPLPGQPNQLVCRQCHVDPDRPPTTLVSLDWVPLPWPATGQAALPGGPPVIPHDLQQRGDCLACHAGPAAVRELRTDHPDRTNCRQCHVASEQHEAAP
jgi:cytochrome c-type protein NapB